MKEVLEINPDTLEIIRRFPSAKEVSYVVCREYKQICKTIAKNTRKFSKHDGSFIRVLRQHVFIYDQKS